MCSADSDFEPAARPGGVRIRSVRSRDIWAGSELLSHKHNNGRAAHPFRTCAAHRATNNSLTLTSAHECDRPTDRPSEQLLLPVQYGTLEAQVQCTNSCARSSVVARRWRHLKRPDRLEVVRRRELVPVAPLVGASVPVRKGSVLTFAVRLQYHSQGRARVAPIDMLRLEHALCCGNNPQLVGQICGQVCD